MTEDDVPSVIGVLGVVALVNLLLPVVATILDEEMHSGGMLGAPWARVRLSSRRLSCGFASRRAEVGEQALAFSVWFLWASLRSYPRHGENCDL